MEIEKYLIEARKKRHRFHLLERNLFELFRNDTNRRYLFSQAIEGTGKEKLTNSDKTMLFNVVQWIGTNVGLGTLSEVGLVLSQKKHDEIVIHQKKMNKIDSEVNDVLKYKINTIHDVSPAARIRISELILAGYMFIEEEVKE